MLCNPNNPTGQPADGELLRRILKKCADCKITLLVDECFVPFLDEPEAHTLKGELAAHRNLIILRAFTKLYAMAGLRLGYLLCANPETIEAVCACEPPWNVSLPAQTAGIAALADGDYVSRAREIVRTERKYLAGELQKLGLRVLGSRANYLFFKCNACRDLDALLEQRGILIRPCANFRGLDERFYRAAVKTHAQNERLVAALGEILKGA